MTQPMKIVIPMAGFGTRLRPLTWSKPKPLMPLAGKTVLDYVLDMFRTVPDFDQAEFVFILGPTMGDQIQDHMTQHYPSWRVDYAVQPEMKGQSDAFWQARDLLHGPMLLDFSDTLLDHDFSFLAEETQDAVALVQPVPDPRRFGVAEVNAGGRVTRLIEKPKDMSNNQALVGCYYFRESKDLLIAIQKQMDRRISLKDEFYLVDAVNIMLEDGLQMRIETVDTWLDAGTNEALLETNRYLLNHGRDNGDQLTNLEDTVIIPPVNIHPSAKVSASVIGPNVSIGADAVVKSSILKESIISPGAHVTDSQLHDSLLGQNTVVAGQLGRLNLGDDSQALR